MIVDIFRDKLITRKISNLPQLYCPDHEICVSYMYVKLSQVIPDTFVTLSSTLVDKSSTNPRQQLVSYYNVSYNMESEALVYQPTQIAWYKMLSPRISDSFFELQLESEHKNVKIEKIYIQLKIRKVCKDSARA